MRGFFFSGPLQLKPHPLPFLAAVIESGGFNLNAWAPNRADCGNCNAACCRLQVLLIDDNPLPERLIEWSEWGGQVMRRLDDGWCAGLDRNTMRCTIYAQRPQICRDFAMGGYECLEERGSSTATAPKVAAGEY